MSREPRPVFRDLDAAESGALLARGRIGRLAYLTPERVDIEPMHYVYDGGWIYGRTSGGTKLRMLLHNPWVAFEVDEVEDLFDWRSVVAKGTVYFADDDETAHGRQLQSHVVEVLRRLVPATMADRDPVPHRTVLFRIHVDELHGRSSSTRR